MAAIAQSLLTNSQLSARPSHHLRPISRFASTLRLWRRRILERRALAGLSQRELADFGATTADVYRELSTPFWR